VSLPDFFARNVVAASQVLAGFDEQRIRDVLGDVRVGVTIGADVDESPEGQALLDLLVRLLARLYPSMVFRSDGDRHLTETAMSLASRINPKIDFVKAPTVELVIGSPRTGPTSSPQLFLGAQGWNAMLATTTPRSLGRSTNPFGAGVAACLGAANLFRLIFVTDGPALDSDVTFSALSCEPHAGADVPLVGFLGEVLLAGAGAIGNGTAWALSRTSMSGTIRLIDPQTLDLGNLQRYVLAEREDEGANKTDVVSRYFNGSLQAQTHATDFATFVASNGYRWPRLLVALDSARDRRAAQASLPQWIANAWTQPGDLGVSVHDFIHGACLSCLYLPDGPLPNEDALVAASLGVSDQEHKMQIRVLLHGGAGVPRGLLEAVAAARAIPIELLLPFEGRPIRALYSEGFCGGAVIPVGTLGTPRGEVHVPLAHQSALAGVLLAGAAVRDALGLGPDGTKVTRVDVLRPLTPHPTQAAAKDARGRCICQDADYRESYARKYAQSSDQSTHGVSTYSCGAGPLETKRTEDN
jgi:hypothetical protein